MRRPSYVPSAALENDLLSLTTSFPKLTLTRLASDLNWPIARLQRALGRARSRRISHGMAQARRRRAA